MPDEDGDGFPEIYGRVRPGRRRPGGARDEHPRGLHGHGRSAPAEVQGLGPSALLVLVPVVQHRSRRRRSSAGPTTDTEADIEQELGAQSLRAPTVVMRGKPQGKAIYNVFLVEGAAVAARAAERRGPALTLAKTDADAQPRAACARRSTPSSRSSGSRRLR